MDLSMFVKSIKLDEEGRIIVTVQDIIKSQMTNSEYRQQTKEMLKKLLKDNFEKLEVSTTSARITVAQGKGEECKRLIEEELQKLIQMAAQFMNNMNNTQA